MKKLWQFLREHSDKNWHYIIPFMDSVEIFYPERDVRDTVKIYRIETQ